MNATLVIELRGSTSDTYAGRGLSAPRELLRERPKISVDYSIKSRSESTDSSLFRPAFVRVNDSIRAAILRAEDTGLTERVLDFFDDFLQLHIIRSRNLTHGEDADDGDQKEGPHVEF